MRPTVAACRVAGRNVWRRRELRRSAQVSGSRFANRRRPSRPSDATGATAGFRMLVSPLARTRNVPAFGAERLPPPPPTPGLASRRPFSSTTSDGSLSAAPPSPLPSPPLFYASFPFLGTPFRLPSVASVAAAQKDGREPKPIVSVGRTRVPDALRLRLDGSPRHVESVRIERAGLRDTYHAEVVYGGFGETVTLRRYVRYAEMVDAICASVAGGGGGGGSDADAAHPYVRGNAAIRELSVQWRASAPEQCLAKIHYQLSHGVEAATADAFDLEIRMQMYPELMIALSRALGQH